MSEMRLQGFEISAEKPLWTLIRGAFKSKRFILGLVLVAIPLICMMDASGLAPHDPSAQNLHVAKTPPGWLQGGSWSYPLGTDYLGRDVLSRVIYGSRVSVTVGIGGVALAIAIGVSLGLVAGAYGGWLETVIMAIVDMLLSLPYVLLVVVIAGVFGSSLPNVILIFGISDFPLFARMTRGEVLRLRESGFVEAARMLGVSDWSILLRHLIPNLIGIIVTVATFEAANMILLEAGLGFLGLSVPPTIPSWGNMLAEGRNYLATAWWLAGFAGVALLGTAMGINLLGDWLRDVLDPRSL